MSSRPYLETDRGAVSRFLRPSENGARLWTVGKRKCPGISGSKQCHIIGSRGGIVPHHWCQ
ncbi:unnamed protein product [Staurois parvus]|uniref:Uncharacterized protein n=1 Tax=Staurois parvus TaxID=386267 RepID=A0ABN9DFH6_9NEOB|nr:unnamed protein product [Staurois parvus]